MNKHLFFIVAFALTSCGVTTVQIYSFDLTEVKNPNVVDVKNLDKDSTGRYYYEDSIIKIVWEPDNRQFKFWLTNKSDESIQVPWDNASYVDYEGKAGRVIHSGVDYIKRYDAQPPMTVPSGSTLFDMLVPVENIYYDPGTGWESRQIIPTILVNAWTRSGLSKVRAVCPQYLGRDIAFLLPIVVKSIRNDYLFTFHINHIPIDSGTIME